jgi:hypothetical protein
MSRLPGYAFEVLEDDEDLPEWAREFCDAHEWRWSMTPTPSRYKSPRDRSLFRDVLTAWERDQVLVRFALRLEWGRAALVAAVRAGDRLIYHHVAVSPAAEQHRAGHVLIRLIGLWMSDRGYRVLDFGVGNEEYKSRYANADEPVWRVFASNRRATPVFLRGAVEKAIREASPLQWAWDRLVNRSLRGSFAARWTLSRLRLRRRLHPPGAGLSWLDALDGSLHWDRGHLLYCASGRAGASIDGLTVLSVAELLGFLDGIHGIAGSERETAFRLRHFGAIPLALVGHDGPLHACWLIPNPPGAPQEGAGTWWILEVGRPTLVPLRLREQLWRLVLERVAEAQTACIAVPGGDGILRSSLEKIGFQALSSILVPHGDPRPPWRSGRAPRATAR